MKNAMKIIIILGVTVILLGVISILYNMKIERITNELLNTSKIAIEDGNYIKAINNIEIIKRYDKNNKEAEVLEQHLKEYEKASYEYDMGLDEERDGNLKKSIETFKEIPVEAISIKNKGNIEIKKITNKINDKKVSNSTNVNVNINNGFKESTEYPGIGTELKTYSRENSELGNYKVMVNYYNPKTITNKSFVDYYENEIYPKLGKNEMFDLIDINKPGYGFVFCGNGKNEVDNFDNMLMKNEFTKGKIGSNGNLGMNDPNSQYGAMVGDKLYVFSENEGGKAKFSFTF
ncbi:MAG: hypothetical protein ACRDAU_11195 [Clostridium sp.]